MEHSKPPGTSERPSVLVNVELVTSSILKKELLSFSKIILHTDKSGAQTVERCISPDVMTKLNNICVMIPRQTFNWFSQYNLLLLQV
jgi:hypothetical protein